MLNFVDEAGGRFFSKFGVIHVRQGKEVFHSLFQNYRVSHDVFYFTTAVRLSDVGADTDLMCDCCLPLIPWHRIKTSISVEKL